MQWRGGVHLCGTAIVCDPTRSARVASAACFVSAAHASAGGRRAQRIATALTLALIGDAKPGRGAGAAQANLPVPYGRPFTIGRHRIELLRSGHSAGAAALLVETGRGRVLYAGRVNPWGGGLGGAAEVRPCDALVLVAEYGPTGAAFPAPDEAIGALRAAVATITAARGCAVILVSSPSKGVDVAYRLAGHTQGPFLAHWSIVRAGRIVRRHAGRGDVVGDAGSLPRLTRFTGPLPSGGVLLWPAAQRARLGAIAAPSRVLLVSGQARDPSRLAVLGADDGIVWSNQADAAALSAYIAGCGAQEVFVCGPHAAALGARLSTDLGAQLGAELGPARVAALGQPSQLPLFD
ncbi:MAG: hypothetical protein Tsb0020_43760 [Haliangiales bacterium]